MPVVPHANPSCTSVMSKVDYYTMPKYQDLTGLKFNSLTVIASGPVNYDGRGYKVYTWLVQCDCGNQSICNGSQVKNGHVKRCMKCRNKLISETRTLHGHARKSDGKSPEYSSWLHAKSRCAGNRGTPRKYYLDAGVKMSPEWKNSFRAFIGAIGPMPAHDAGYSLDRWPNPQGNYEPGNVRWATKEQQSNNKASIQLFEWKGEKRSKAQIARLEGVNVGSLTRRIKSGHSVASAISEITGQ